MYGYRERKKTRISFTFGFFAVWSLILAGAEDDKALKAAFFTAAACLIHETGHIIVMKIMGIEIERLTFFSGGIALKGSPSPELLSPMKEAAVLSAGCVFSFFAAGAARLMGNRLFMSVNLALGLFNLLPVSPLDGGMLLRLFVITVSPRTDIDSIQQTADIIAAAAAALLFMLGGRSGFTLPLVLFLMVLERLPDYGG